MAPAAQLDRVLEAWRHSSSTAAARSRGARLARLEEQSDDIGSFRGVAWWPAARRRGTARGGEAGDAWVAAPVAGAAVLDKNGETFLGDQRDNKEQLSFLGPLPNPSGLQVINYETNSKLNLT
jgi:hypothetical protein